ncbi:MAG TPA: HD domain-containing phosphohydrolase [Candidatus Fermentibacter daniensis]|jgi:putative methionine-R-sulfoxide reductase with GAF domain/nucleoside diphosphate kinase|nr:HD domain-containing phosphohydrolase [Candidatus Fermentibacter daniensis]
MASIASGFITDAVNATGREGFLDDGSVRLESLLKILKAISRVRDLNTLLALLASETSACLGAERSTVFIYDRARNELWSIIAEGMDRQIRIDATSGLAGHVLGTGSTLITGDVSRDGRFDPSVDRSTGFTTRNALTVPIRNTRGEVTGVFQAVNKSGGGFSMEDADFLEAVAAEAGVTIENVSLYEHRRSMLESLIKALAESIEARDPLTAGHSENVMKYAGGISRHLGLSATLTREIEYAALLHDYGKIGVPDAVLRKPDPLDENEIGVMRSHVERTGRILSSIDFEEDLESVPQFAVEHHERLDGSGYPAGVSGDAISIGGRIIAVADVFEALTAKRHYRDPMDPREALGTIRAAAGTAFDAEVVDALQSYLEAERVI